MATFLNTVLNNVLLSLETEYNVYEVYDVDDANVILNDVQEASFPVAFFSIKNNGAVTLTRHKKSYPVYDVAVWLLNLYQEDDKSELETNYEGLRLDALEFLQRFQRTTAFARVPTNTVLSPRVEEFDAQLDLLATALQITFTASIDIGEDTSRVCAPLSISSFTLNDTDLDAVVLDASASSYRGTVRGATAGTHNWAFVMNGTSVTISGLATSTLSDSDVADLGSIGMANATGTYNSFTFEKNPERLSELNFIISVSHTYDFRSNGESSPATTNSIDKIALFIFTTNWDPAVHGNFTSTLNVGGVTEDDPTWYFPNGEIYTNTETVSISDGGLDGTPQKVRVLLRDFSLVTGLGNSFLRSKRLTNDLDLSLFTSISGILSIADNSDLNGELIFPESSCNYIFANDLTLLPGEIILKYGASCRFDLANLVNLEDLIFESNVIVTSELNLTNLDSLTSLSFPDIFDISGLGTAQFQNSGLSQELVDHILVSLSTRTGFSFGTEIRLTGNSAPSATGNTAKGILTGLGYIINTA
jgi:hypothetical protein